MKICFLAHANSIHTTRWATFFRNQGHECHILSFIQPGEILPGVTFHIIRHPFRISHERSNWQYLFQLPTIWLLIRQIKPQILNAHFLSSYGFLGALTCPKSIPLVISLHGSDILTIPKRSLLHRWIAVFSLSHAMLITSVAKHMTEVLSVYVPSEKSIPVLTLQYGINTQDFYPPQKAQPRLPIVFSSRSMVKVSHLESLIQSAAFLKELDFPFQFYIAGSGELQSSLEKQAGESGLQKSVQFLGIISAQQMASLLHQISIYVSTSTSDGASIGLLEAMACGAFPVVTDIPANREWIRDGENGLLTKLGSSRDLAEKIMLAWKDEPLRQRAATINWKIIQERGDYQTNMKRIEESFINLLH